MEKARECILLFSVSFLGSQTCFSFQNNCAIFFDQSLHAKILYQISNFIYINILGEIPSVRMVLSHIGQKVQKELFFFS